MRHVGRHQGRHALNLTVYKQQGSLLIKSGNNQLCVQDMADCSEESPGNCKQGDLTSKHGMVPVGKKQSMFTKKFLLDSSLQLPDLGSSRSIYLTLFDTEHPDSFLACAQIRQLRPKTAKATFGHDGIIGHVGFTHPSPFHPAQTDVALAGLHDGAGSFHIHEFPVPNRLEVGTPNLLKTCNSNN